MELIQESLIIKSLLTNQEYFLKCFPYLDSTLFDNNVTKKCFNIIKKYCETYKYDSNQLNPTILEVLQSSSKITNEADINYLSELVSFCRNDEKYDLDFLVNNTITFIKTRKYFEVLSNAAEKYESNELDESLPSKLEDIFGLSLDEKDGTELNDFEDRWNDYTIEESKIPFLVQRLNEVTKGGVCKKTLNCLMSTTTGGFKSGTLCSFTCDYIRQGYNVLYITLEMAENKIFERIDANLLHTDIDDIKKLGKEKYINKMTEITSKFNGKLIVKQYPTANCSVINIKNLLNDLKLKQHFIPDVLVVDYLGIMSSVRYKGEAEHIVLKSISEELRGLAVEYDLVCWTATQSNRQGFANGEVMDLNDISGSYGVTFGLDLLFGIVTSEEFDKEHKILFKQLKNRYSDQNFQKNLFLNIHKAQMRISDLSNSDEADVKYINDFESNAAAEQSVFKQYYNSGGNKKPAVKGKFVFDEE